MTLNDAQKYAIGFGAAAIIAMGLFPPWKEVSDLRAGGNSRGLYAEEPIGYAFIAQPPKKTKSGFIHGIQIDNNRLLIQWAITGVFTGLMVILLSTKES